MSLIVGLMVLGVALIMIEIFVPGGIVGAIGGICLLVAVGMSFKLYGAEGAIIAFVVSCVVLVGFLIFEFKVLPKTSMGRRFFLTQRIAGTSQGAQAEQGAVGREGLAVTALSPSGYVLVDGQRLEAYSRSGFVDKGEKVRVDSIETFKVTVSKI